MILTTTIWAAVSHHKASTSHGQLKQNLKSLALAVTEIFQGCKISGPNHAPFRDDLALAGWDFLWSTCVPNLNFLTLSIMKMRNANARCSKLGESCVYLVLPTRYSKSKVITFHLPHPHLVGGDPVRIS